MLPLQLDDSGLPQPHCAPGIDVTAKLVEYLCGGVPAGVGVGRGRGRARGSGDGGGGGGEDGGDDGGHTGEATSLGVGPGHRRSATPQNSGVPRLGGETALPTAGLTLHRALHDGRAHVLYYYYLFYYKKQQPLIIIMWSVS